MAIGKINIINYDINNIIKTYLFGLFMINKNITIDNINVFKDLVIY